MKLKPVKENRGKRIGIVALPALFVAWLFYRYIVKDEGDLGLILINTAMVLVYGYFYIVYGTISPFKADSVKIIDDPFTQVSIEDKYLCVGSEKIDINRIKKVVIEVIDDEINPPYALFQLPFNPRNGKIHTFLFNAKKVDAVKDFLNQHLSDVEYIT